MRRTLRGQLEQGGLWFANRVGLLTGALDWEYWEAVGDFGRALNYMQRPLRERLVRSVLSISRDSGAIINCLTPAGLSPATGATPVVLFRLAR